MICTPIAFRFPPQSTIHPPSPFLTAIPHVFAQSRVHANVPSPPRPRLAFHTCPVVVHLKYRIRLSHAHPCSAPGSARASLQCKTCWSRAFEGFSLAGGSGGRTVLQGEEACIVHSCGAGRRGVEALRGWSTPCPPRCGGRKSCGATARMPAASWYRARVRGAEQAVLERRVGETGTGVRRADWPVHAHGIASLVPRPAIRRGIARPRKGFRKNLNAITG